MRTTRHTMTFALPFSLSAVDDIQPAGTYTVAVDEEPIEGLSFLAYRRVATTIFLPVAKRAGSIEAVIVDPHELAAAHARDGATAASQETPVT
jgi:hypothetical protein